MKRIELPPAGDSGGRRDQWTVSRNGLRARMRGAGEKLGAVLDRFHHSRRLAIVLILLGLGLAAPIPAGAGGSLPFTAEENADGARFVWYVLNRSGMTFEYVPTVSFPESSAFRPIEHGLQDTADVAWWPKMMAIYDANFARARELPDDVTLVTAGGPLSLKTMEEGLGPARFYRYKR